MQLFIVLAAGMLMVSPVYAADATSTADRKAQEAPMPDCTKMSNTDARQDCGDKNKSAHHDAKGRDMDEDRTGTDTMQKMKADTAH